MAHSSSQAKKATASGWIGSALEYYDFFIYAQAAALIFPQIFFPQSTRKWPSSPRWRPTASATWRAQWAPSCWVTGVIPAGAKTSCCCACSSWACRPWPWACCRLTTTLASWRRSSWCCCAVQGFAVAGEISGASSMIMEHAPFGRRGYYASYTLQGVQAGQVMAAAVFLPLAYFMPSEAFNEWGWRIPFLMSALVLVAGFIIRKEVHETPHSSRKRSRTRWPSRRSAKPSATAGSTWCW